MHFDLNRFFETGAEVAFDGQYVFGLEHSVRGCQVQADDAVFLGAFDADEL
jgi:predicted Co/Zn/Cd cation transporter (cation efflux family)